MKVYLKISLGAVSETELGPNLRPKPGQRANVSTAMIKCPIIRDSFTVNSQVNGENNYIKGIRLIYFLILVESFFDIRKQICTVYGIILRH